MEREIFKQLGQTREQFLRRPAREVDDYLTYIQLIQREEQARSRRPPSGR